jgi:hypothetical protein
VQSDGCAISRQTPPDGALKGAARNGELWALPIGDFPPKTGQELKLVMRVTGTGDISVVAVGPNGARHGPIETQRHVTSNFDRPGEEWGSFFTFDRSGCWRIVVTRGDMRGSITLAVKT